MMVWMTYYYYMDKLLEQSSVTKAGWEPQQKRYVED